MAQAQATTQKTESGPSPLDLEGICLLSLDGGGVRGLSSLYVLKRLMTKLNYERHEDGLPAVKPCEVFDLIGGTSTGGIIAIMLGRLEMDVDACISAYTRLMKNVFGAKGVLPVDWKGRIKARLDSEKLKGAIEEVLHEYQTPEDARLDDGVKRGCHVFVCAASKESSDITRLRSYRLPDEDSTSATVCEAALATSAATSFFEPITIGARTYVDGALRANNPVVEVRNEASNIWCTNTGDLKPLVKCFVSIGTGNPGKKPIEDKAAKFFLKALVQLATETEKTAEDFVQDWRQHFDQKRYFRFNVQQGLQDIGLEEYEKQGAIEAATDAYLSEIAQKFSLRDCASNLKQKQSITTLDVTAKIKEYNIDRQLELRTATVSLQTYYEVPHIAISKFFGREQLLCNIDTCLKQQRNDKAKPTIVVLQAMGGQGKSQIALEYCRRSKEDYRGIFWVDATSRDTAERSFENITTRLNKVAADSADDVAAMVNLVLDTIGQWKHPWLLVFDNYDRPEDFRTVRDFFPDCGHGSIIITSRHEGVRVLGKLIPVPSMTDDGGLELLLRDSPPQHSGSDRYCGEQIVRRLGGLALAIEQAAAFIDFRQMELPDFLPIYEKKRKEVLQHTRELWEYRRYIDDSEEEVELTAFTTWEMSFEQIKGRDQDCRADITRFLSVSAFLEPSKITEYLFRKGHELNHASIHWLSIFTFPDSDSDSGSDTTDEDNIRPCWDQNEFEQTLQDLRRLSLIQSTQSTRTSIWFSIHPLIRDWLQLREKSSVRKQILREVIRLVASVIRDAIEGAPLEIKHELLTHLDSCMSNHSLLEARELGSLKMGFETTIFGEFYRSQGHYKKSEELFQILLREQESKLGQEHPSTLTSMANLASTYRNQGRWKEAEELDVQVMETRKRVLGQEHPDTLTSMANLSWTFRSQGYTLKAIELMDRCLQIRKKTLGEEHINTISSKEVLNEWAVEL